LKSKTQVFPSEIKSALHASKQVYGQCQLSREIGAVLDYVERLELLVDGMLDAEDEVAMTKSMLRLRRHREWVEKGVEE